jgi:acyl-homoserine-lactone acylase
MLRLYLLISAGLCFVFSAKITLAQESFPKINPADVTIVRDSFGIPHIFAKTDAEVAYGLAWASSEDAFEVTQDLIYASKGFMGRKGGKEGAKTDFFVHAIGARELVNEKFDSDIPADVKKYIDGYAQGLNAYAAAHPAEVKEKNAFPVTAKDMITAWVVVMSAVSWTQNNISDAVNGKYDSVTVDFPKYSSPPVGSNAFALKSMKMEDGKTFLCINPHLRLDGPFSFYEAHLQSEEGLNIEGCMFQGCPSLAMGVNENLGWGMTWNTFDKVDVFKLKMNPANKMEYEFDGKWEKLEARPVKLKVNIWKKGRLIIPVKRTTYWSKYGATVKSDKSDNYYAVRFPANMTIGTAEQVYRMNKANSYREFWDAIHIHALTLFNIVYADREDNIFYMNHGMIPERDTTLDWSGLVAGNTSRTLWTKMVPLDSMGVTINPKCGYVFNTNNSPFHASGKECNDGYCPIPRKLIDGHPYDNNRAVRFQELISAKDKFNWNDLHDLKFDITIPKSGDFEKNMAPLFNLDENKYPDVKEAITILKTWNRVCDIHEYGPTLLGLTMKNAHEKNHLNNDIFEIGVSLPETTWVAALREVCDTLNAHFGTVKVEWGTIHRLIRGNKDIPLRGFPDVLSPSYPKPVPGKFIFKPDIGDTFTMFAEFGKKGVERMAALQPLGNSLNPKSKHYNDQMEIFSKQALRTVSLKKADVMKRAESVYHPQ